ncbi:hypothetical protein SAMD00019534_062310 [Acytostelium subglobosum LB1]|uniref:hypothetical protein n=1 Tax=Acytostelium subglobosum LB1 TaxID=1410327 RepID=UPI000644DC36|nr:hypothetical protein SAMD00019534_062310 [Acytostelium subglobosum LB1]GAM23056.1 hypothetical protein SAMD00019534_062310 [Acytostelium subglobosum LB1]|eukprot:XP_012754283.1 hypothetical protein SAMD00019534_062310 [Acytostelium subglobosum LB1]
MTIPPTTLFPSELLIDNQYFNNEGIQFRPLQLTDYDKGFSELLQQLTEAKFDRAKFVERFLQMKKENDTYFIVVAEDVNKKRIIATGSVVIEKKFIRGCALCGHIEDIVVDQTYRGKNLGLKIIDQLKHIGSQLGCYKLILDCEDKNQKFYEKCGFERKQVMMALYLPRAKL